MALYQLGDVAPLIAASAWVADGAQVIGAVELADDASVWFGVVLRGDNEPIRIGRGSNVQDGSIFHTDPGYPLTVGEFVTVGHQVMLHGCTVGDNTLIGIGAVVLNGAKIGRDCTVGAGALVTLGKEFPDGSLIVGSPARQVRRLTAEEIESNRSGAEHYRESAQRFRGGLRRIDPAG
jgi:carbonic anhydrase/acetyltransferase-like protein (isoleucine patch superfamily)